MNERVEKTQVGPAKLENKRVYLPFKIVGNCPTCGKQVGYDLSDRPLNYPTINGPELEYMYCGDCDENWEVVLLLTVDLAVVPKSNGDL